MNFKQATQRVQVLIKHINRWNYHYYVLNESLVSDQQFDAALRELKQLETRWPRLRQAGSPTQTVGAAASHNFPPAPHAVPMLSLKNAFSIAELVQFDANVKKMAKVTTIAYVCELKIDGLSVNCRYRDGQLTVAATRGDGVVGENITTNAYQLTGIPFALSARHANCEVRGEVFFARADFQRLNQQRRAQQQPPFANARNAAAGTLRTLDHQVVKQRQLSACFYDVRWIDQHALPPALTTQMGVLGWLQQQRFPVIAHFTLCHSLQQVVQFIRRYEQQRHQLNYDIDGVVVKVNDQRLWQLLGTTAKAPRWAIAYKFPAESKTTQLLNVYPTVGRTGRITYNAQLTPVQIAGTWVRRATLHNASYILSKDIRIHDYVRVKKAGDIIPEVIGVDLSRRQASRCQAWTPARLCPNCQHQLVKQANDADQYCLNTNCVEQKLRQITFFCSKLALDIQGLSRKTITKLYERQLITRPWDLFTLEQVKPQLLAIPGFKTKLVDNLLGSIAAAKHPTAQQLLVGLGIAHVGVTTARQLVAHFHTITAVADASLIALTQVSGVGEQTARAIRQFWAAPAHRHLLGLWAQLGIRVRPHSAVRRQQLTGLTFLFSGKLSRPRSYYQRLIQQHGGQVARSWSRKINYLVVGDRPGSKLKKAQISNVKIIAEQKLQVLLDG